jgi:pimeloyl-ACP methyl ester carboxylesterase
VKLADGGEPFDVTVLEPPQPTRVVLFAAGRGGNPERHLPLLESLAARGCAVVAPHFERLAPVIPTAADLRLRLRRTQLAFDAAAPASLPVAGVGHSLGGAMLLALAGAQLWTIERERLDVAPLSRLDRLVLLAPPTDFFRAPGALDGVRVPILAWAGSHDPIAPPEQVRLLERALAPRVPVETRVVEGGGHFSFMNVPPPQTTETLPDREAFLATLADEIGRYLMLISSTSNTSVPAGAPGRSGWSP